MVGSPADAHNARVSSSWVKSAPQLKPSSKEGSRKHTFRNRANSWCKGWFINSFLICLKLKFERVFQSNLVIQTQSFWNLYINIPELCVSHIPFFFWLLTSTTAPSPVNLVSFVIFELLGGAVAAGLFRLTEMETTAAKDEKVKMGMWLGTLPWNKQQTFLKITGWKMTFSVGGWHILGSYLSFREGSWLTWSVGLKGWFLFASSWSMMLFFFG